MWRGGTCTLSLSVKQPQASLNGGRLAKAITNIHQPPTCNVVPSCNSIYCVNGFIGDTPVNFLVDSGAAMSVVHYNLVKHLHCMDTTRYAVGANGNPLDVVGQTTATITLSNFTVNHNFIVVRNLTVDCLLGADFMQHHAAILDCAHIIFSLGRESKVTIPTALQHRPVLSNVSNPVNLVVHPLCDLEIPARSVQLILGTVDIPSVTNSVVLIETVETLPNQLHVAYSLSPCCDNKITIQVLNVIPSPITIFKGMSLGTVTLGDDVSLVCADDTQTAMQVVSFDHLHLPNLSESKRSPLLALLSEFSDIFTPITGPKGALLQLSMLYLPQGHQSTSPYGGFQKL